MAKPNPAPKVGAIVLFTPPQPIDPPPPPGSPAVYPAMITHVYDPDSDVDLVAFGQLTIAVDLIVRGPLPPCFFYRKVAAATLTPAERSAARELDTGTWTWPEPLEPAEIQPL